MRQIKVGEVYRHFKGHLYVVLDIINDADSIGSQLKKVVIYQELGHKHLKWARKYDDFTSKVDKEKYPNVKQKYRFEKYKISEE